MANPNPEIYRTPEHWVQCKILSGTSEGVNRPKIVDWCGDNQRRTGTIGSTGAVPNGYLQASEPLDLTLCPTGQHPNVSCFSEIWRFQNPQSDAAASVPAEKIERKNAPCNWTFGEVDALFTSIFGSLRDKASPLQRWSPNSANDNGANTNWNFCPFVTWGVRGALLQIKVMLITDYDNYNGVLIPRYNTNNIMSLDEWKNNHSDKPIQSLDFTFYGNTGESNNTITYATSWIYNDGTCVGACSIDQCGEYAGEPYYDYTRAMFNRNNALILLPAGLAVNYNNTGDSIYFYALDKLQGAEIRGIANTDNGWRLGAVVPYSQANYDAIMKMAACFAMAFTPTSKGSFTLTDNDYYLPIIRADGVSYGEYTHGADNATNATAQISDIRTVNYDPSANIDPNTYSDTTNWNNVDFRQAFTKRYLLTGSQVAGLATELWAAQSSKPADIDYHNFAIDEYLTNNPIDTIVSLKYFPCTFTDIAPAIVRLGKYTTNIAATALGTSVRIIDFAPIECFSHFNDFRDYEPYTELAMYIPFCGTVKIPTAECMGNYVSVKLAIDTNTGAATGYIIVSKTGSGGICVATCQGMAAIDIPVSGLQSANLANAVFNATANWTQTQVNNISANTGLFKHMGGAMGAIARGMTNSINLSDVKSGILGGPIGAAGSLVNRLNPISAWQRGMNIDIDNAKADYELSHIQVPTRLVGSASPALGCVIELDCRLIIYRPVTDENALSNYADTVGFATVQGGTVGQFSGFTVGTIDVSGINATAKEKQAIAAAFANGVYL